MKNLLTKIVAVCLFLGITGTANAQPAADASELQLSLAFFHAQSSDVGSLNFDASYGKYLGEPNLQLGVRQSYFGTFVEDGKDSWLATTAPFLRYHFNNIAPQNLWVPYVGGFLGAVWNDKDIEGTVGPEGGLKVYLTSNAFFNTNYRYEWFFQDVDVGESRSRGNHILGIGLGYQW